MTAEKMGMNSQPATGVPATSIEAVEPRLLLAAISFEPAKFYPAGASPTPITVGDFNRDGINDLAVAGEDPVRSLLGRASVRILLGKLVPGRDGTGTTVEYAPPSAYPYAGVQASGIVAADFNRDGKLDVAVSNNTQQGSVYVLLGKGDGTLAEGVHYFSGSFSTGLAVADFNGDRNADLIVSNAGGWTPSGSLRLPSYGAAVLLGKGDGTFQRDTQEGPWVPQHFVKTGDVNGDGRPDAVFGRVVIGPGDFVAPESQMFATLGDGAGGFAPQEPTTIHAAIVGMDLGDVNGDARPDVAVALMHDFMTPGEAGVLFGRGDGTFAAPRQTYRAAPAVTDVAIADLDADGRPDLAVSGWNPNSAAIVEPGSVVALRNLGGGAFGDTRIFGFVGATARLAAGYLNRDLLPDLVATQTRDQVAVLVNNTKTIFARGLRVLATEGMPLIDRPVARFAVTGAHPNADSFSATILWGDGTGPDQGKIVANSDGTYSVLGSRTYRRWGTYRITILIRWPEADATRITYTTARVAPGPK